MRGYPFNYKSVNSSRDRLGVSQHARKPLKSLLHLGALTAIRVKPGARGGELKYYYQRKVEEGKNKMLVLEAVHNKLIHRICAVVERG